MSASRAFCSPCSCAPRSSLAGVWHLLRDRLLAALVRRLLNAKLGAWAGYGDAGAVSIAWIALSAPGFPASFELTASKLVWRNPRGGDGQAAYATRTCCACAGCA